MMESTAQSVFAVLRHSLSEFVLGYREGMAGKTTYSERVRQLLDEFGVSGLGKAATATPTHSRKTDQRAPRAQRSEKPESP
jgi:hypothetical protein